SIKDDQLGRCSRCALVVARRFLLAFGIFWPGDRAQSTSKSHEATRRRSAICVYNTMVMGGPWGVVMAFVLPASELNFVFSLNGCIIVCCT
uniref:MFS domain-containing protein n=1 Tax=Macrostomum lignano TaxID=282301 RepID=A0A1I8FM44_9PLAT